MITETLMERHSARYEYDTNGGCWLWKGAAQPLGYGQIKVDGRMSLAHRVSWELHRGPIPEGICVLHRCDIPACVNPDHLFLGTRGDNNQDKYSKGRAVNLSGENHWKAKLTAAQVKEIHEQRAAGAKLSELAQRFGVHFATIGRIARGKAWVTGGRSAA